MSMKPVPVELLDAKPGQRQSTSCSECSRRKTRCDKKSPCEACIKRGKAHICRVPGHITSTKSSTSSPAPTDDLDLLAFTAFREVEDVRTTIDSLRTRVASLETLLLQTFGKLKEARKKGDVDVDFTGIAAVGLGNGDNRSSGVAAGVGQDRRRMTDGDTHASTSTSFETLGDQPNDGPMEKEEGDDEEDGEDLRELREEEVAASLSLEYMALGRNRALTGVSSQTAAPPGTGIAPRSSPQRFDPTSLPPNPINVFPTIKSFAGVIPPYDDAMTIVKHAVEWTGWYHGVIHAPTFLQEVAEFWGAGEHRLELTHPAWLALFFAQLSCGIKHMTKNRLAALGTHGLSEAEAKLLAKTLLDASLAALYRSNFLEVHHLYAVQTIAALVITCQDGGFSNLFPTLLNVGIAIAQDLGLHRLPSRHSWEASVASLSQSDRAKSLIDYELKKRIFWALTAQDWFNISFRRTTAVQPSQVTTPLPANARDEDLALGTFIDRPMDDYTGASNILLFCRFGKLLQKLFAHVDENPTPSYDYVLELDREMQSIIDNAPAWVTQDERAAGTPYSVLTWIRNTFKISSYHKILTLHRPFLHRAFRDPLYETSRLRALQASRAILRESLNCGDTRLWTVPYHISAAASVVCLDLFQKNSPKHVLDEEREEVRLALQVLQGMESISAIANRGVALVENLLAEESRLREDEMPSPSFSNASSSTKRKRKAVEDDNNGLTPPDADRFSKDFSNVAKRLVQTPGSSSTRRLSGSPSSSAGTPLPTYPLFVEAVAPSSQSAINSVGARSGAMPPPPPPAPPHAPSISFQSNFPTMPDFDFGPSSTETLPAEYLSVFLGSGFDPLDLLTAQTWSTSDLFDSSRVG